MPWTISSTRAIAASSRVPPVQAILIAALGRIAEGVVHPVHRNGAKQIMQGQPGVLLLAARRGSVIGSASRCCPSSEAGVGGATAQTSAFADCAETCGRRTAA